MAERGIHAAAPFPRLRQDHVRVILAEPIVQTGAVHMAGAWFIAGMGRISITERNTTMASDYVDDFLRDERESFKRKEAAAKKFDSRLDNFRKSAQVLRDAARQFEEAFPGMSRTMIADKLAMTGTEKNVAFDAKGELVAAPAGRKPRPPNPNGKPSPNRIRRRPDPTSRRRTTRPPRRRPQPNPTPRTTDGPHGRPATTDDRT